MDAAAAHTSDGAAAAELRKTSKLTFLPAATPDAVIVKSFTASRPFVPQPPFPRLHPTVSQERARPYLQSQEEEKKRKPPAIISIPPPTTPWYPEQPRAPVLGKPLTPNLPTSLSSPRSQQRVSVRHELCQQLVQQHFSGVVPPNVAVFYSCLAAEMSDSGLLTPVQLTKVFVDICNVTDISTVDTLFKLIDVKRKGVVPLAHVIVALDTILNQPNEQNSVAKACFEPFNVDQRGYIHKSHLDTLKASKDPLERDPIRTPQMVKVLIDLFLREIAQEEEDAYLMSLSKGKKKSKKAKAPPLKPNQKSIIPIGRARVSHMNFETFARFFRSSKSISVAFARCWLPVVEDNTTVRLHVIQRVQDMFAG